MQTENTYLNEVMAEQAQVKQELKRLQQLPSPVLSAPASRSKEDDSLDLALTPTPMAGRAIPFRITGW